VEQIVTEHPQVAKATAGAAAADATDSTFMTGWQICLFTIPKAPAK